MCVRLDSFYHSIYHLNHEKNFTIFYTYNYAIDSYGTGANCHGCRDDEKKRNIQHLLLRNKRQKIVYQSEVFPIFMGNE